MGDWTGTVPSFPVGNLRAADMTTLADIDTALTTAATTWSPTHANLTIGSGTVTATYRRIGKFGDYSWSFLLGAGSAVGTLPSFTLPFTPHSRYVTFALMGAGKAFDAGTANYFITGRWTGSAVELVYPGASGIDSVVAATTPFTFTSGDRLMLEGCAIEIA